MTDEKIAELERELVKLKIDFDQRVSGITKQIEEIRQIKKQSDWTIDSRFKLGDWVKITNEYRSIEKGIVGEIIKVNKPGDRLWMRDSKGRVYQRAPWNVKRTTRPKQA